MIQKCSICELERGEHTAWCKNLPKPGKPVYKGRKYELFLTKKAEDFLASGDSPPSLKSIEEVLAVMHNKGFDGHVCQTDKGCCASFVSRQKPYIVGRCGFETTPLAALLAAKNDAEHQMK